MRRSSATPGIGVGVEIGPLELDNEFFVVVVVVAAVLDSSLGLGGGMIRAASGCGRRNHWYRFLPALCRFVVIVFSDGAGI